MARATAYSFSTRAFLAHASEPAIKVVPLVPIDAIDKYRHDVTRGQVSREAGHERRIISTAYLGARPRLTMREAEKASRAGY